MLFGGVFYAIIFNNTYREQQYFYFLLLVLDFLGVWKRKNADHILIHSEQNENIVRTRKKQTL